MRTYLVAVSLLASILFLIVVPTYSFQYLDFEGLVKGLNGHGKIWFFGNSVIRHSSKCDTDHRSISDLFAAAIHQPVVDMSRGGMRTGRMLDIVEVLVALGLKPKAVYIQVPLDGDVIAQLNEISGVKGFFTTNFSELKHKLNLTEGSQIGSMKRVAFNGHYYGDYGEFSKKYFVIEKQQRTCPETMGVDKDFIAFMYWRNFLEKNADTSAAQEMNRIQTLVNKGIKIVFWIAPVNSEDISALHGSASIQGLSAYKNNIVNLMKNFTVVDMSHTVPANHFADRWCACGHLNDEGRLSVVSQLIPSVASTSHE